MLIKKLELIHFRNYETIHIEFGNEINVFYGNNAQGKTNLIEAIYFLSLLKSFRNHKIKDLFFFDRSDFQVKAMIEKNNQNETIGVSYYKKDRRLTINSLEIKKANEYIGFLNVIAFTPDDLNLIKGFPSERRRLMDIEIAKVSPIYLYSLSKYQYLLKQRNAFLKSKKNKDLLYLDILNQQMGLLQIDIIKKRRDFINRLQIYAGKYYQALSKNQEQLVIDYRSCIQDLPLTKETFNQRYAAYIKRDIHLSSTSFGVHREDVTFYLDGKIAADFASQGQQRSIVLAIKLALINYIFDEINDYPILLLDDVLSELDEQRKQLLFTLLDKRVQTFITTTSIDQLPELKGQKINKYHIKHGSIISCEEDVHGR